MGKLTSHEAFELGNHFHEAAIALDDWRIKNRASLSQFQWDELDDRMIMVLNNASSMYTSAVGLILEDSQAALARLQSSVKSAKSAVHRIAIFKEALDLASALVFLAGAITSGNVAVIPAAVVALEDAAAAIVDSEDSGA
jgi:hypothetical protein